MLPCAQAVSAGSADQQDSVQIKPVSQVTKCTDTKELIYKMSNYSCCVNGDEDIMYCELYGEYMRYGDWHSVNILSPQ